MKNKIIVALLAVAMMCFGLTACLGGDSSDPVKDSGTLSASEPDESTGGDSGEITHTYEIAGAKDLVLKKGNADYNYLDGVSGKADGKDAEVTADTENVNVNEAGVYELTYTLGTATEKVSVYVIDYTIDLDEDGYLAGTEISLPEVEPAADYGEKLEIAYAVEGIETGNGTVTIDVAGTYQYKITFRAGGAFLEVTEELKVVTAAEYYGRNLVKEKYADMWASQNVGDGAVYDEKQNAVIIRHNAEENNTRAFLFDKNYYRAAYDAGMTELVIRMYSTEEIEYYIDSWEDDEAYFYDSPWGGQPWNMVTPYMHETVSGEKTVTVNLDIMSKTGTLCFLIAKPDKAVAIREMYFVAADHDSAYAEEYADANTLTAEITVTGTIAKAEVYVHEESRRYEIAKAGGLGAAINGDEGSEYFGDNGARTYKFVLKKNYKVAAGQTDIEIYIGDHLVKSVSVAKELPENGVISLFVNEKPGADDSVGNFKAKAEKVEKYDIDGAEDVILKIGQDEYDFIGGRTLTLNGAEIENGFTVDSSAVAYDRAGKYAVVYASKDGKFTQTITAYVVPELKIVGEDGKEYDADNKFSVTTVMGKVVILPRATSDYDGDGIYAVEYSVTGGTASDTERGYTFGTVGTFAFSIRVTYFDEIAETVFTNGSIAVRASTAAISADENNTFIADFNLNEKKTPTSRVAHFELMIGTAENGGSLKGADARAASVGLDIDMPTALSKATIKNKGVVVSGVNVIRNSAIASGEITEDGLTLDNPFSNAYDSLCGVTGTLKKYRAIVYKTANGKVGAEFYVGNAAGNYVRLFAIETTDVEWPTGNVYAHAICGGSFAPTVKKHGVEKLTIGAEKIAKLNLSAEFEISSSVDTAQLGNMELLVGKKATTVEEARKGAGLIVTAGNSITFAKNYDPSAEGEAALARRSSFAVIKNPAVLMNGTIDTRVFGKADNYEAWANYPFSNLYNGLWGAEATSRTYKIDVTTDTLGYIGISVSVKNAAGEYVFIFSATSLDFRADEGDTLNIVVNNGLSTEGLFLNYKLTDHTVSA